MKKLIVLTIEPRRKARRLLTLLDENKKTLIKYGASGDGKSIRAVMDVPTFKSMEKSIDDCDRYLHGRVVVVDDEAIESEAISWLSEGVSQEKVSRLVTKRLQELPASSYQPVTETASPANFEDWNVVKRAVYHLDHIVEDKEA